MHCRFAFTFTASGQFQVRSEVMETAQTSVTTLQDENEFIQSVVLSLTDNEAIMQLISHVLLATAGRCPPEQEIAMELSVAEWNALGLCHVPQPSALLHGGQRISPGH